LTGSRARFGGDPSRENVFGDIFKEPRHDGIALLALDDVEAYLDKVEKMVEEFDWDKAIFGR
jgi:hypothetical protein